MKLKQSAPYSEILFGYVKKRSFNVKNCECECMYCKIQCTECTLICLKPKHSPFLWT